VRHTDAGRLAQSGAGEDDRAIARELVQGCGNLVRGNPDRPVENDGFVVVTAHVDEERARRD